jgi:hypothetical protein
MKRTILVLIILFAGVTPVHAETPPAIAIIDTGMNTTAFKDSIVYEVCILTSYTCPNKKMSMEGLGAANLPTTKDKTFNHGTQMASVALAVNPSAKIIPIRIVGMSAAGTAGFYSLDDVQNAFNWIVANRVKYNIAVVSLAQGAIFPGCKVPAGMAVSIATLKAANVPVITAVGNNGNHTDVFAPACLTDTVSVGATDNPDPGVSGIAWDKKAVPYIARYSNGANGQTDFFTNARWYATMLDGSTKFTVGTSNSTAAMAGWWLLNKKATFDETFKAIMATTIDIKNEFQTGRYVTIP